MQRKWYTKGRWTKIAALRASSLSVITLLNMVFGCKSMLWYIDLRQRKANPYDSVVSEDKKQKVTKNMDPRVVEPMIWSSGILHLFVL
jgi:hypothetical protein